MANRIILGSFIAFLLLACVAPSTWGNDATRYYDRVNLSVRATQEVDNDTLVAVLYYQREGSDPTALADEVNKTMGSAIKRAKETPDVTVQTIDYQTRPVYRQQTLSGWRVRQSARLESQDSARLSKLIGELQEHLAIESVGYEVSPRKRAENEEALIAEAISAFQERAQLITRQLGRMTYRLVRMDVNTSGAPLRPIPMRTDVRAMAAAVAPPVLEAGTQTVEVTVNGTIELQLE